MVREHKISGWRMFWDNLEWGPRGALLAFLVAIFYYFITIVGPLILNTLYVIFAVLLITLFGAFIGSIIGWVISVYKKRKHLKR